MKKWMFAAVPALALMVTACNDDGLDAVMMVDSGFQTGNDGWVAGFSEYSTKTDTTTFNFASGVASLPRGLDTTQRGFLMQSNNRSDDMFMYLKKKITGLVPNGSYELQFNIDLATKYPENSFGAGGSPGSSIYLKAGAATTEPGRKLVKDFYEFTLDKGAQSESGKDGIVLGNIGSPRSDTTYTIINRSNAQVFPVKASTQGELWLFAGTDSGSEVLTRVYYDRIRVRIVELQGN